MAAAELVKAAGAPDEEVFGEDFRRKLAHLARVARTLSGGSGRGERRSGRLGAGLEFADHRAYAPGDDLARIDWNLFGRLGRPLVRLFEAEEELPLHLLLDTSGSMAVGRPPKRRLALQLAAALGYLAAAAREAVWVQAFAETPRRTPRPGRGGQDLLRFLDGLGALPFGGGTALDAAALSLLARHRRRGQVVVLSDFFGGEELERALARLRHARFEVAVVAIRAPEDRDVGDGHAEEDQDLLVVDAETGAERRVWLTAEGRRRLVALAAARLEALAGFCRRQGLVFLSAGSEAPFEKVVLQVVSRFLLRLPAPA